MDERDTRTWSHAILELITHALDREPVEVTVENAGGERSRHRLDLAALESDFSEEDTLDAIGVDPWRLVVPAVVGSVAADSPADRAGIRPGDRIVAIDGSA